MKEADGGCGRQLETSAVKNARGALVSAWGAAEVKEAKK
jgi:hypothetical protein